MDGLECSEIRVLEILADNEENRIDSEYYKKEYLVLYKKLKHCENLGTLAKMHDVTSNGSFERVHDILNDNNPKKIPYIRSGDVGETFLDPSGLMRISEEAHKNLPLSQTSLYDVMMARKGKIGGATIITEQEVGYNCNENVIKLTINDRKKYNPYYVTTYFNSYYGKKQIERLSTGNVQPWVSIYQMKKLRCPYLSTKFQSNVEETLSKAYGLLGNAKKLYYDAEKILLGNLGMQDFSPTEETVAVKDLSQSFGETGRLDAEYYQPKYDDLFAMLRKVRAMKLGDVVNMTKSIEPGSEYYVEKGIPFVRVSDVNKFEISEPQIKIPKNATPSIEKLYPKEDTILFSKDGSVGIAYKVEEDCEFVTSSALLHLTVKNTDNILSDYLTLVLNSLIVQLQAERDSNGAVIQHWKPSEIEKVLVPILDMDIQKEIAKEIQSSFILRKQSKQLLDCATRAVEMAIEQSEEKATAWLNEKVKEIESL